MNALRKYLGLKIQALGKFVLPYGTLTADRTADGENGSLFVDSDLNALSLYHKDAYRPQAMLSFDRNALVSNYNEQTPGFLRATDTSAGAIVIDLDSALPDWSMVGYIDTVGQWGTNALTLRSAETIQGEATKAYSSAFGSIQLIKHPTAGWIPFGGGGPGGGGGSGIGIGAVEIVTASKTVAPNMAYLVDTTLELEMSSTVAVYADKTLKRIDTTIAGVLHADFTDDPTTPVNLTDDWLAWYISDADAADGNAVLLARSPENNKWFIAQWNGAGVPIWFQQADDILYDHPIHVETWYKVNGTASAGTKTEDANFSFKTPAMIELTLPSSHSDEDVYYFGDFYPCASKRPFALRNNGNKVNGSTEDILFDADNTSLELQQIAAQGLRLVRGMGISQGGAAITEKYTFDVIGINGFSSITGSGDLALPFHEANMQRVQMTGDVNVVLPETKAIVASSWIVEFIQPAEGDRYLTFDPNVFHVFQGVVNPNPGSTTVAQIYTMGDGKFNVWLSPKLD